MAKATTRLTNDAIAFLTERHLAMLTTLRSDNSPHVVAVGFTFDPKTHIARVITSGGSQKAVNAENQGVAVLSQVDGARWLSLEGKAAVNTDADAVRDAELRYAQRYRTPRANPKRVVIEVRVERVLGSSDLLDRGTQPSIEVLAGGSRCGRAGRHHDEFVRAGVDRQRTVGRHDHDVLDPGTPLAREVDAGLDGERHALLERQVVARDDVGLLVHRQTRCRGRCGARRPRPAPRRPARRGRWRRSVAL